MRKFQGIVFIWTWTYSEFFKFVLDYHWRFIVKNPLRFYWQKIFSIHYLHFPFENHVLSQVLKDFSGENLEITSSTFLSTFSCKIYLSRIIKYWGIVSTLYLMWGAFSLFVFYPFLYISSFFLFLLVFSLTDTNDS